jgi:hypothetical protein
MFTTDEAERPLKTSSWESINSLDILFIRDRRVSNTAFSLICAYVHLGMTHHYSDMTTIMHSLIRGFL